MKFFYKEDGVLYLVGDGKWYLQPINEWAQFLRPTRFNWITFTPIRLDFDLMLSGWRHFDVELFVMGFGLRWHISFPTEKQREDFDCDFEAWADERL